MNVAVMGAGAVGCYFGGMLARAGHEAAAAIAPYLGAGCVVLSLLYIVNVKLL